MTLLSLVYQFYKPNMTSSKKRLLKRGYLLIKRKNRRFEIWQKGENVVNLCKYMKEWVCELFLFAAASQVELRGAQINRDQPNSVNALLKVVGFSGNFGFLP